jgi:acyl-CoA synthetase (AMP-forming)/AMP-acid ligase II
MAAPGFHGDSIGADNGLVIIHTAAVAGRPRGALVSHANLLCASLHLNYCFSLTPADVHLNLLPCSTWAACSWPSMPFMPGP